MLLPLAQLAPSSLLWLALAAIAVLVLLIARLQCNATIALTLVSLLLGLAAGMEPLRVAESFRDGVAATLGNLAMIIGLGTMLAKMLAESGGAQVLAEGITRTAGARRLDLAIALTAYAVGVTVFFQVGLVLLGPITFALAQRTGTPILRLGLPMVAALSTAHGLIPPHPGPLAAIEILHADVGRTIAWSLLVVGPPIALITGPLFARWITPRIALEAGGLGAGAAAEPSAPRRPGFALSLFTILLPVLLMLLATMVDVAWPAAEYGRGTTPALLRRWTSFFGHPVVAMLVAVLFSFWSFGKKCGLDAPTIGRFAESSLAPVGSVLLVIAAGGGFSKVLNASGIGEALAHVGRGFHVSPILLGWLIASMLRIAVGSATVAVTTAAGIMLPLVQSDPSINRELLVIAMGAGSLILSHVNDGGFWLVKEYFGMKIGQMMATWTVLETGIAVLALPLLLLLDRIA